MSLRHFIDKAFMKLANVPIGRNRSICMCSEFATREQPRHSVPALPVTIVVNANQCVIDLNVAYHILTSCCAVVHRLFRR